MELLVSANAHYNQEDLPQAEQRHELAWGQSDPTEAFGLRASREREMGQEQERARGRGFNGEEPIRDSSQRLAKGRPIERLIQVVDKPIEPELLPFHSLHNLGHTAGGQRSTQLCQTVEHDSAADSLHCADAHDTPVGGGGYHPPQKWAPGNRRGAKRGSEQDPKEEMIAQQTESILSIVDRNMHEVWHGSRQHRGDKTPAAAGARSARSSGSTTSTPRRSFDGCTSVAFKADVDTIVFDTQTSVGGKLMPDQCRGDPLLNLCL